MTEAPPGAMQLRRNTMILLSLGQGLALLFLWRAATGEFWPAQTPTVNFPLWTIALVWPTLLLFTMEHGNTARAVKLISLFTALLALLAAYVGWQASPYDAFPIHSLVFICAVTLAIANFKALVYLQPLAARRPCDYGVLFACSWRNFLVAALAAALALGVHAILLLWSALFSAIGIEFFSDLFAEDWFLFPVLCVAFGVGIFIFRSLTHLIDGITGLLEGLMRLLLPLVLAVAAGFLGALPFTGLAPLWGTGHGTGLLLWLSAFALFFVNAVYQTGDRSPYPPIVHRVLMIGVALLPFICALALLGLYLRIAQYGLTVERCWGVAVALLLTMFSTGYAWGIVRRRSNWPQTLARTNTVTGWVVLGLMLAVNSPLLDFRSISVANQFARVDAGDLDLADFDFHYARRHLARPAYMKMQALIEEFESSDPALAEHIRNPEPVHGAPRQASARVRDAFWKQVIYRPERFDVPAQLRSAIEAAGILPLFKSGQYIPLLVRADLNDDGTPEYTMLGVETAQRTILGVKTPGRVVLGDAYYLEDGEWKTADLIMRHPMPNTPEQPDPRHGAIEVVDPPPAFKHLKIGELIVEVRRPDANPGR